MHSLLPYVLLQTYFLAVAYALWRVSPFYRRVLNDEAGQYLSLDGLRGFLALGVFFHHAVIAYYAQKTGVWAESPLRFFTLTGHIGVGLFFMITGFLFWEKALLNRGRFVLRSFYLSRLRRLAPAYLLSVLLVIAAAALPFTPHTLDQLLPKDIRYVLMFKGLRSLSDINGIYWTLVWEWRFYLLLPLAALTLRGGRRYGALLPVFLLLGYTLWKPDAVCLFNFICGGAAAWLRLRFTLAFLRTPWAAVAALAALALIFIGFDSGFGYAPSLLMFVFFLCIVAGNSLFGLLHSAPARAIGAASYSLYLLHCIVLYVLIYALNAHWQPVKDLPFLTYWLLVGAMGTVALLLSWLSYRYVEHPFLSRSARARDAVPPTPSVFLPGT